MRIEKPTLIIIVLAAFAVGIPTYHIGCRLLTYNHTIEIPVEKEINQKDVKKLYKKYMTPEAEPEKRYKKQPMPEIEYDSRYMRFC